MLITPLILLASGPANPRPPMCLAAYSQLRSTRFASGRNGLPDGGVTAIRIEGGRVVAAFKAGTREFKDNAWRATQASALPAPPADIPAPPGVGPLSSLARARNGDVLAVGPGQALRWHAGKWGKLDLPRNYKANQPVPNIDTVVTGAATDSAGTVWLATDHGLIASDGGDWWHPLDRADGVPYEEMTCVAIAPNGDVWGGTTEGAWRMRNGQFRYFWGLRWLPGNRVSAIAVDEKNAAWIATENGIARIEERPATLKEKAAHYEQITAARHNRRGYVTSCVLNVPGEPEAGFTHEASDNDGLWTALYVAAESFRYAATKDPKARALARTSMEALLDLVRLSGVPGFPARAVIQKGEKVTGYDPDDTVRIPGETDKIWFTSRVNPNILCKGDTSSDELDGHYFAWYIYHELVATDGEKAAIREVVRAVTNNIVDHQYTLIGHTGRRTLWGAFGPQFLNDDPRWFDERGLNSSELLCYLKVAYHICGDRRFLDAYNELIDRHHYLLNTLNYRRGTPWFSINHSDDELAYCVYYPLLMLEKDPHRRTVLVQTIAQTWHGERGLRHERSPFYNFIYGAATGADCLAEEAVQTLEDWPWELIHWPMRNSHRHDVTVRSARGYRNKLEIDRALPMSERRTWRWNGNPFEPDGGNAGEEEDGAAFLLPYWLGRYHRIIAE